MAGMATAARLTNQGFEVHVFEQADRPGGKLARYERDGFVFDLGPSLFTIPAVYRDLFLKTGAGLETVIDLVPLEPAFRYQFSDGAVLEMPGVGINACAHAIQSSLGGSTGSEWRAFMARASDMWALTRQSILQSPIAGIRDMMKALRTPRDILTIAPWLSLRTLSKKTFSDSRLVTLVDRYATYTGSDPRQAPAALATVPYVEQEFGAWHIGGGIARLADALFERCRERGVIFHFNEDVQRIIVSDGIATGIETAVAEFGCDIVVVNADAQHLYGSLLTAAEAPRGSRRVNAATKSLSGFVVLLALSGKSEGLLHHNVWFPENYDAEFDAIFSKPAQPVADPTIYVCNPDDPAMRPHADSEAWFVLVNAPRHGDDNATTFDWSDPVQCESYAQHIVDVLAARGMDVRSRIQWMEWRSPRDLAAATRAPGGAIYGTSSNGAMAAFLRASNKSEIKNVYVAGGSAHPGGGLPLVGMSAEIVADLIKRDRNQRSNA
jgi:phytoene desaturase